MSQAINDTDSCTEHRIDLDAFVEWCESQKEHAFGNPRFLLRPEEEPKDWDLENVTARFVLRDIRGLEKISFVRGRQVDTIIFKHDNDEKRFHAHRHDVTFTDRNIIIRHRKTERELTRAGTSNPGRGAFPV